MAKNIVEQLAAHAHDLAHTVGGKHPVEVWAWVKLDPGHALMVTCKVCVGRTGDDEISAYAETPEAAFVKCVKQWQLLGAPTEPETPLSKLEREADKLGLRVVPKDAPILDTEIAGTLAAATLQAANIGAALAGGATTLEECKI